MAADGSLPDSAFTGWRHYFNTYTIKGRSNVAFATYGSVFLGVLLWKMKSNRKKAVADKKKH